MRPACVPCGRFMRPSKNGRCVLVMADDVPYQIWMADEWVCERCQSTVIVGFGRTPISEHFMPDFARVRAQEEEAGNLVAVE